MKRRQAVSRYPSGQIHHTDRGEKPEQIIAVARAQPHRMGSTDPRVGYAYGRLRVTGQITQRQFEAADIFTKRVIRYMAHITNSIPRFPSIAAEMVASSTGSGADLDPETIAAIRSDYGEVQDALADSGLHYEGNRALTQVCVMDREPRSDDEMGNFRLACNAIAHRLRIG